MIFESDDFVEIQNQYEFELILTMAVSSLASMYILYFFPINMKKYNAAELVETVPIVQWNYDKLYWKNFKRKELQKKGFLYCLKILLILIPVVIVLCFIYQSEPMVSIMLLPIILICIIPMIPFTVGRFYNEVRNQLFQNQYEVKIFKQGLSINEVYYPYNQFLSRNDRFRLINIEKKNVYSIDCLKFSICKWFYSGDDSVSELSRKTSILIPFPKKQDVDLVKLKKELMIK